METFVGEQESKSSRKIKKSMIVMVIVLCMVILIPGIPILLYMWEYRTDWNRIYNDIGAREGQRPDTVFTHDTTQMYTDDELNKAFEAVCSYSDDKLVAGSDGGFYLLSVNYNDKLNKQDHGSKDHMEFEAQMYNGAKDFSATWKEYSKRKIWFVLDRETPSDEWTVQLSTGG